MQIDVNRTVLNIYDRGSGPVLLFVHGFPLNHTMWYEQLDEFASTHRVIAPDLRGLGGSEVTEGAVSMEQYADDLAILLDVMQIRGKVALCGLSMGGYIAFEFVRKYQQRLSALVLCDTKTAADKPAQAKGRRQMADMARREGTAPVADAMLPKLLGKKTLKNKPDVVDSVRQMILTADPRGVASAQLGMAERRDSEDVLATINVPTLVIVGEDDALAPPAEMREIASKIKGAQFVVLPGVGHMPPVEDPRAFNTALRTFLARLR